MRKRSFYKVAQADGHFKSKIKIIPNKLLFHLQNCPKRKNTGGCLGSRRSVHQRRSGERSAAGRGPCRTYSIVESFSSSSSATGLILGAQAWNRAMTRSV